MCSYCYAWPVYLPDNSAGFLFSTSPFIPSIFLVDKRYTHKHAFKCLLPSECWCSAVNFSEDEDKKPPYFHLTGGEVRLNVAQKATLETNSRFFLKTDKDTFSRPNISPNRGNYSICHQRNGPHQSRFLIWNAVSIADKHE